LPRNNVAKEDAGENSITHVGRIRRRAAHRPRP
jgi:hypothetical protein